MEVIFLADQIPEERQWALILMAGGDEAYNRWDTLEDTVCWIIGMVSNETNEDVRMYT